MGVRSHGNDLPRYGRTTEGWSLGRPPKLLETSLSGVFAVGDIRHASVKRVASAEGEGSISVRMIHEYLDEENLLCAPRPNNDRNPVEHHVKQRRAEGHHEVGGE
jgi:hypothetical protein